MILVLSLYGLMSSGESFRSFLDETLYYIGYVTLTEYTDVWMRPSMKCDGFQYCEYALC